MSAAIGGHLHAGRVRQIVGRKPSRSHMEAGSAIGGAAGSGHGERRTVDMPTSSSVSADHRVRRRAQRSENGETEGNMANGATIKRRSGFGTRAPTGETPGTDRSIMPVPCSVAALSPGRRMTPAVEPHDANPKERAPIVKRHPGDSLARRSPHHVLLRQNVPGGERWAASRPDCRRCRPQCRP
jgi:hypothetical protein